MKRYNINVYNGWPMIFDLSICFIYAAILPLYLLAFTPLIIIFIKNQRVYYLLCNRLYRPTPTYTPQLHRKPSKAR